MFISTFLKAVISVELFLELYAVFFVGMKQLLCSTASADRLRKDSSIPAQQLEFILKLASCLVCS